jgi:hypothetical protein
MAGPSRKSGADSSTSKVEDLSAKVRAASIGLSHVQWASPSVTFELAEIGPKDRETRGRETSYATLLTMT